MNKKWKTIDKIKFTLDDISKNSDDLEIFITNLSNLKIDTIKKRTSGSNNLPDKYEDPIIQDQDDEGSYPEGEKNYKLHIKTEGKRSAKAALTAKENWMKTNGALECQVCNFNFSLHYGDIGIGFIEAHHTLPVAKMKKGHKTNPNDLALVCSNCHKMLHKGNELKTIDALKKIYEK